MSGNLLQFYITDNIGTINIPNSIPRQTLRLKQYTFQWKDGDTASANASRIVLFDTDWLSQQQCLLARSDGKGVSYFSFLNPSTNGVVVNCDISVAMSKDMPRQFSYSLKDRNNVAFADGDLLAAYFVFEYDYVIN